MSGPVAVPSPSQNPLADFLDSVAAQARAGKIAGVGLIIVSPSGGLATQSMGPHGALVLGCEILKRDLVSDATKPATIIRPN